MPRGSRPIAAILMMTVMANPALAQERSLEFPVKATFLAKFGSFVEWPQGAFARGEPVQLCVVGRDPFGATLDGVVEGQTINGHPIAVRRMETISAGAGCHIAYLAGSAQQSPEAALRVLEREPVLTVTEGGSRGADGAIQFLIRDNRVRFRIDQRQARIAGLNISSKLLNLAIEVAR